MLYAANMKEQSCDTGLVKELVQQYRLKIDAMIVEYKRELDQQGFVCLRSKSGRKKKINIPRETPTTGHMGLVGETFMEENLTWVIVDVYWCDVEQALCVDYYDKAQIEGASEDEGGTMSVSVTHNWIIGCIHSADEATRAKAAKCLHFSRV